MNVRASDTNGRADGGRVMAAAVLPLLLTPGSVTTVLLKLLNSLTPLVPVAMTTVTTDDFLVASEAFRRTTSTSPRDDCGVI